jgi:hypothetical protein
VVLDTLPHVLHCFLLRQLESTTDPTCAHQVISSVGFYLFNCKLLIEDAPILYVQIILVIASTHLGAALDLISQLLFENTISEFGFFLLCLLFECYYCDLLYLVGRKMFYVHFVYEYVFILDTRILGCQLFFTF